MKNLGNLMKQAQQMQAKMQELQQTLAQAEVTGASGGGMVQVVLNGKGEMRKLTVDPSVVDPADKEILEDLVVAAHNDAKAKAEAMMQDEMKRLTGGLSLPPGMSLPF
jgi:DNA-binding YbaB/EbfC family protein